MTTPAVSRGRATTPAARGEDTRTALMTHAIDAFATQGYEAMSVRELTRRLNVSHNIVHHHFKSKRELWRAAMQFGLAEPMRELIALYDDASTETADPERVFRHGIYEGIMLFARFPAIARIIANESAQPGERLDFLFEFFIEPLSGAVARFVRRKHRRYVHRYDPRCLTLASIGGLPGLLTHAALARKMGLDPDSSRVVSDYADTVANLLITGLVEPGAAPPTRRRAGGAKRRTRAARD